MKVTTNIFAAVIAVAIAAPPVMADNVPQGVTEPLFYGFNYVDPYNTTSPLATGLYTFQGGVKPILELVPGSGELQNSNITFYAGDKFYVITSESDWLTGANTYTLYGYNTSDWSLAETQTLPSDINIQNRGIAWDAKAKKAYYIQNVTVDYFPSPYLYAYDPTTNTSTQVCALEGSAYYTALLPGPSGTVYLLNGTSNHLERVDIATGNDTDIAEVEYLGEGSQAGYYDSKTNLIYYSSQDADGTEVYSINPSTAEESKVCTLPNGELLTSIYLPEVAGGVPDAPTNVALENPFSYNVKLHFDVPSTTFDGQTATGNVTAVVSVDGKEETSTVATGSHASIPLTLDDGAHSIVLALRNAAGTSRARRINTFTGADTPSAVGNLKAVLDSATGKVALTWEQPKAKHDGYLDTDSQNYTIVRQPNNVVLSEHQKELSYTDQLSDAFAHYTYQVISYVGGTVGDTATTEAITYGDTDVPPFTETFEYGDFGRFTNVNGNEDGYGWQSYGEDAFCFGDQKNPWNYSLYTPKVRLSKNKTYTLSFTEFSTSNSHKPSRLFITMGKEANAEAQTRVLIDTLNLSNEDSEKQIATFKVAEDGIYYIGFHAVSGVTDAQLHIDNVSVTPNSDVTAPEAVSNLKATPDAQGALKANISFTTPTKNADGTPVGNLTKVNVYRGEAAEPAYTFNAPAAGESLSWADGNAEQGFNLYRVTAYSQAGKGMDSYVRQFVGVDVPGLVQNLRAKQVSDGVAQLTWDAPSTVGANGGYVSPEGLTYTITRADGTETYYSPEVASDLTATSFTDDTYKPAGQQGIAKYQVIATNAQGSSSEAEILLNVGTPYALPYTESFSSNAYKTTPWTTVSETGALVWGINTGANTSVKPVDGDQGMLQATNNGATEANSTFVSPRISLKGASDAKLTFYMYHSDEVEPEDITLTVKASADDADVVTLGTFSVGGDKTGWQRHTISLSQFAGADNVILMLYGHAAYASSPIFLDKIKVNTVFDNDLSVANMTIPENVEANKGGNAVVSVANEGRKTSRSYTVRLLKNGEEVASQQGDALAVDAQQDFTFDLGVRLDDAGKTLRYEAQVDYAEDGNTDNNYSDSAEVYVKGNLLPAPELEGDVQRTGVKLTWTTPKAEMPTQKTDGFEDYAPYSTKDFGHWSTYDGDGKETYWTKFWNMITNAYEPFAWEVWNNETAKSDGESGGKFNMAEGDYYTAHNGNQSLIAFTAMDDSGWFGKLPTANDNWLISEEVAPGTDVSFWLRNSATTKENFEVYYATELPDITKDLDESSFTLLQKDSLQDDTEWRQFEVSLPADAKCFAIRHCTQENGGIVLLDDVAYTPATGSVKALTLDHYNIYRDGVKIAETKDSTYTDAIHKIENHTYTVTAVWTDGESLFSNEYFADIVTGINSVNVESSGVKEIYDVNGRKLQHLQRGLNIIKGTDGKVRKVIVK